MTGTSHREDTLSSARELDHEAREMLRSAGVVVQLAQEVRQCVLIKFAAPIRAKVAFGGVSMGYNYRRAVPQLLMTESSRRDLAERASCRPERRPRTITEMSLLQDKAVVLARVDYSETSQVIAFFTRAHGKVRAIAKGVKRGTKRRFAAGLDLLEIGEVVVSAREGQSGLATLTEWKQSRGLLGLREKLSRIHAGLYVAELANRLTEDLDPHPTLFDAMVAALMALNDAAEPLGVIVPYQRALLEAIGSLPRFDGCVSCGRADDLTHFSSHEGGMICRHCEPNHVEKREVVAIAMHLLRDGGAPPTAAAPHVQSELRHRSLLLAFDLLDYHLSHLMGRRAETSEKVVPLSERRVTRPRQAAS